jgi:AAA15 family ATPase/GTPase
MTLFNFTIGNYRSIAGKKILSLEPAVITDFPQNVIQKSNHKWLSSAVIYGANASGKSNLLHAMSIMKQIIVDSFDKRSVNELPYDPFLLSTTTPQEPTFYEIEFLVENIKF